VVQAEAERHRAGLGHAGAGAGERLGVVVVSVDEQKLEAGPAEQGAGGAEEAASFRVARQVAEVSEGDERVAALLDGSLDQVAQVASVAVQVAEDEQPAPSSRGYPCALSQSPRARIALLTANPAEVEGNASALANGDDHVSIGTGRAHPLRERLVVGEPGVSGAK
jgi:hypothetical protein